VIVVTQEGAIALWRAMLGIAPIGYPYVRLFGTAHTPAHGDTDSTYAAIELAVAGYAPIQLTSPAANWTLAPIGAGAQATYLTLAWSFGAACTVYGYWLDDGSHTYSLWAEAFPSPFVFGVSGGPLTLQLVPWLASWPDIGGIPCTSP
jgi:hypothetical protein